MQIWAVHNSNIMEIFFLLIEILNYISKKLIRLLWRYLFLLFVPLPPIPPAHLRPIISLIYIELVQMFMQPPPAGMRMPMAPQHQGFPPQGVPMMGQPGTPGRPPGSPFFHPQMQVRSFLSVCLSICAYFGFLVFSVSLYPLLAFVA